MYCKVFITGGISLKETLDPPEQGMPGQIAHAVI